MRLGRFLLAAVVGLGVSAQALAYTTISMNNLKNHVLNNCKTSDMDGGIWDSNLGLRCVPASVAVDSDARAYFDEGENCRVVDEVDSSNQHGQCLFEPQYALNESGEYGIINIKVTIKKVVEAFFRVITKAFKAKRLAKLDEFCGNNGLPSKLLQYATAPDTLYVCSKNMSNVLWCDEKFSTTTLPECHSACKEVEGMHCNGSGGGGGSCEVDFSAFCDDSAGRTETQYCRDDLGLDQGTECYEACQIVYAGRATSCAHPEFAAR